MANEMAVKDDVHYIESWATFAEQAGLVPQGTNKYQAMAIVQAGREMGLQPLQSLRTMNFIKGRLVMSVQLQLALAKNTKNVTVKSLEEGEGFCKVALGRNDETITCEYTIDDAQKAGLVKPDGNWQKYGRQMLRWRAIGDALKIICPDLVMGLLSSEEAGNIECFAPSVPNNKPEVKSPQEPAKAVHEDLISEAQAKRFYAIAKGAGWNDNGLKAWLVKNYKIDSMKKINRTIYEHICEKVKEDAPAFEPAATV